MPEASNNAASSKTGVMGKIAGEQKHRLVGGFSIRTRSERGERKELRCRTGCTQDKRGGGRKSASAYKQNERNEEGVSKQSEQNQKKWLGEHHGGLTKNPKKEGEKARRICCRGSDDTTGNGSGSAGAAQA